MPSSPRIVVDPSLPEATRMLLRRWDEARVKAYDLRDLKPRQDGPEPEPRLLDTRFYVATGGMFVLVMTVGVAAGADLRVLLGLLALPALVAAATVAANMSRNVHLNQRRLIRGAWKHYVVASDLDGPSRELLVRVQRAIDAVLGSQVGSKGLVDGVRHRVELPAVEWEIAAALHRLSQLRGRHSGSAAAARLEEALADRAAALEELAEMIAEADARHVLAGVRDRAEIELLTADASATADSFEDVLARICAPAATPRIEP